MAHRAQVHRAHRARLARDLIIEPDAIAVIIRDRELQEALHGPSGSAA
jgi:hypothetical protein